MAFQQKERQALRTQVKICCIASIEEADLASAEGADFLGLVGPMPTGPGVVTLDQAHQIATGRAWEAMPILLTAAEKVENIASECEQASVRYVQLVRHVAPAVHRHLAKIAPDLVRIQVIHVDPTAASDRRERMLADLLELMRAYGDCPDYFLLDSGRPAQDELGGTGRAHDWAISAKLVAEAGRPVFLAGGLTPENVGEAISRVRPFGVDLCSGVRVDGQLDPTLLRRFFDEVHLADAVRQSQMGS